MIETSPLSSVHHSASTSKAKKNTFNLKKTFARIFILILLAGLFGTGYLYYQTRQELKRLSTQSGQEELAKKEIETVVQSLGKLTILPQEEPVLATILDREFLATQSAFYKDAANGDKLVVYPKAQKAYIYSPERNIVVNAGPLIVDQGQAGAEGQQNAKPVRVEIRNGSSTVGAGTALRQQLGTDGIEVTTVTDAANKDYTTTQVFAINKDISPDSLKQFADKFGGQVVTTLPAGEATSQADVLIIVGNTQAQ